MVATFSVPSTIITGAGARNQLPLQLKRLGARGALLVTDPYLEHTGLARQCMELIERAGIAVHLFAGVQPDPTDRNVRDGLIAFHHSGADVIVALGGGSAIDAAKAIAMMTANDEPLRQYMGYHKVPNAGAPVIAIPTTAGTGSEATKVAVITDTDLNVKMMMLDTYLLPTVAIVDYELSMTMPPALTAHVGVDTLTHGIEAFVSCKANAMSDPLARSCIQLCADHLFTAWSQGDCLPAREGMAVAACQGGMAFANSSVCLVHGMSRPLGAVFHVPHGLSNAMLLPTITHFSIGGALPRYAEIAHIMGYVKRGSSDEAAAEALVSGLQTLNERLEIPRLRDCKNMDKARFVEALDKMAEDALASGSPQNNPIVPSHEQIVELYGLAW